MTNSDTYLWQTAEYKSGWLMGSGFGVLVCVIAAQLPNDAFERWTSLLVIAAVVTFVWGVTTYKLASKKSAELQVSETED
jgi:uncharacterized membrane protein YfcA